MRENRARLTLHTHAGRTATPGTRPEKQKNYAPGYPPVWYFPGVHFGLSQDRWTRNEDRRMIKTIVFWGEIMVYFSLAGYV